MHRECQTCIVSLERLLDCEEHNSFYEHRNCEDQIRGAFFFFVFSFSWLRCLPSNGLSRAQTLILSFRGNPSTTRLCLWKCQKYVGLRGLLIMTHTALANIDCFQNSSYNTYCPRKFIKARVMLYTLP